MKKEWNETKDCSSQNKIMKLMKNNISKERERERERDVEEEERERK